MISKAHMGLTLSVVTVLTQSICLAFGGVEVSGRIVDGSNNPIGGVAVAIFVQKSGSPVVATTSDTNTGHYELKDLKIDGPFDVVFTHSKYDIEVVCRLSGTDRQEISKVLYLKGFRRPKSALSSLYLSLERLTFLASDLNERERTAFIRYFGEINPLSSLKYDTAELIDLSELNTGNSFELLQSQYSRLTIYAAKILR